MSYDFKTVLTVMHFPCFRYLFMICLGSKNVMKSNFLSIITSAFFFCFQDGEAYAYLLNALAPEHSTHVALDTKDPTERAKKVLEQAEKLDCKRYLSPKDIVDGSANLNLAFVAQIFQHRSVATGCFKQFKCIFQWFLDY